MKKTLILAIIMLSVIAGHATATIEVSLSANPINCKDPFDIIAKFSTETSNSQVDFYVDNIAIDTKNINGQTEEKTIFQGENNWDKLMTGSHTAKAELTRHGTLMDSGSIAFEVAGRRCPQTTTTTTTQTTTTTIRYNCASNVDCKAPVSEAPECSGQDVIQRLMWGECENASTPEAICADKEETAVVKTCQDNETCENGECKPEDSPATTAQTTTTVDMPTTSTTQPPATTTAPIQPSTTQVSEITQTTIFGRTNTRLDTLLDAFEAIIRIVFFWR